MVSLTLLGVQAGAPGTPQVHFMVIFGVKSVQVEQNASVANAGQVQLPGLQENSGWLTRSSLGAAATEASMLISSLGSGENSGVPLSQEAFWLGVSTILTSWISYWPKAFVCDTTGCQCHAIGIWYIFGLRLD
jgi:hypothetical protein